MKSENDDFVYDVRLQERFLRRAIISRKDLDARLSKLDDVAAQAESINFEGLTDQ